MFINKNTTAITMAIWLVLSTSLSAAIGDWIQYDKLTPSDAAAGDYFGCSVDISGNIVIIGAYGKDDVGSNSGAAYLFDLSTGEELGKLVRLDPASGDYFGKSVAISGTTALVSSYRDHAPDSDSGSAYLFDTNTLSQFDKIVPTDPAVNGKFGYSVAIDGDQALLGTFDDDVAYTFDVDTGDQQHRLSAEDLSTGTRLGYSVALDGNVAVTGAPKSDSQGAVYLFNPTSGQQIAKLTSEETASGDLFGTSVAIDGNMLVVGANSNDANGINSGAAYLFDTNSGNQLFNLTPDLPSTGDSFGSSVAINATQACVGAPSDLINGKESGSASIFNIATGESIVKLSPDDGANDDKFGNAVAISGETAVVGSYHHQGAAGAVYLFGVETGLQRDNIPLVAMQISSLGAITSGQVLSGYGTVHGTFVNNGEVKGDGTTPEQQIVFDSESSVSGTGTYENSLFLGAFSPGSSIATTEGTNLGFGGTVQLELGSDLEGYDQIHDQGTTVIMDNTDLSLRPWNDFLPQPGDEFVIMNWANSLEGSFDKIVIEEWFTNHGLDFVLSYEDTATAGQLTLIATNYLTSKGDINGNGRVDSQDLNLLLSDFTSPATAQNQSDLATLLKNFGRTELPGPSGSNPVPEPSTALLIWFALAGIISWRRHHHN